MWCLQQLDPAIKSTGQPGAGATKCSRKGAFPQKVDAFGHKAIKEVTKVKRSQEDLSYSDMTDVLVRSRVQSAVEKRPLRTQGDDSRAVPLGGLKDTNSKKTLTSDF